MRGQTRPCPICRAPVRWEGNAHRPFCSERCRLRDLGSWAAEDYRIAAEKAEEPTAGLPEDGDEHAG